MSHISSLDTPSHQLRDTAAAWLAAGERAMVVSVSGTRGSAPRDAGARLLVTATRCVGTVGGGHLEWQAIAHARQLLHSGAADAEAQHQHLALGPSLGQCCGGTVALQFEALTARVLADWPVTPPLFHLQLHGAGHVGRAIARLLVPLPVRVDWIDEREDEFPAALLPGQPWPAHIRRVAVDGVDAEVALAPPGAFYLVLTHQHDLDLQLTHAILARGDAGYLGLIGSATKRQRFVHRLEERGFSAERIAGITCPIGVPGIPGKEPELLALGVVAQLLQVAAARQAAQTGAGDAQPAASVCSAGVSSTVTR
jgi:xanthine dehydrogenase accessory factor